MNFTGKLCYIECDILQTKIESLETTYNNIEYCLLANIFFYILFLSYFILKKYRLLDNNKQFYFLELCRYYAVICIAFNMLYFYLFMI